MWAVAAKYCIDAIYLHRTVYLKLESRKGEKIKCLFYTRKVRKATNTAGQSSQSNKYHIRYISQRLFLRNEKTNSKGQANKLNVWPNIKSSSKLQR